jgi:hypothetical protein
VIFFKTDEPALAREISKAIHHDLQIVARKTGASQHLSRRESSFWLLSEQIQNFLLRPFRGRSGRGGMLIHGESTAAIDLFAA